MIAEDWAYKQELAERMDKYPKVTMQIVNSVLDVNNQEDKFLKLLFDKCRTIITLGRKGSGKTLTNCWIAYSCYKRGYKIFYRNADFPVPKEWQEISYNINLPYKEVYEYVLKRPIADSELFEDIIIETRKNFAKGLNKEKILIIHDEVSADIDSKTYNSPGMKNLRHFGREQRKLGAHSIIIHTDVLASNISLDYIRSVDIQIFKHITEAMLSWDRDYFQEIVSFIPQKKEETLVIFQSEVQYLYLEADLGWLNSWLVKQNPFLKTCVA